jgi:hypothetical protein
MTHDHSLHFAPNVKSAGRLQEPAELLFAPSNLLQNFLEQASGEFVHVELAPGVVTILPAWKLDSIYCAGIKVGEQREAHGDRRWPGA